MMDIDNIEEILRLDSKNQFEFISDWSSMIKTGFKLGEKIKLPEKIKISSDHISYSFKHLKNIGICGMGGSAISGEYLQNYLNENNFHLPINIVRGYKLPFYFNNTSLVIAISYSGNTRETLSCLLQALKRRIPLILVSSGGILASISLKFELPYIKLPEGYAPRAAFPILFSTLCGIISSLFPSKIFIKEDLIELSNILEEKNKNYCPNNAKHSNLAKNLAEKWFNKIPVFISEYQCLGMRMKGQLNENSKKIAYFDIFPELMHNTVQGWKDININSFHFVRVIIDNNDRELIEKTNFSLKFVKYENLDNVDNIIGKEAKLLHNLFCVTFLIDYVSLYLAVLQNIDPSDIDVISGMKNEFEPKLNKQFHIENEIYTVFE